MEESKLKVSKRPSDNAEGETKKDMASTMRATYMASDPRGKKEMVADIDRDINYMISLKKGEDITNQKHDFYKELIKSKEDLLSVIKADLSCKPFFSTRKHLLKNARLKVEAVRLESDIYTNNKVFKDYVWRKQKNEEWIEKLAQEVNNAFDSILNEAKGLGYNIRLAGAIQDFESKQAEGLTTQKSKIEFYVYMKSEIKNSFSKAKKV